MPTSIFFFSVDLQRFTFSNGRTLIHSLFPLCKHYCLAIGQTEFRFPCRKYYQVYIHFAILFPHHSFQSLLQVLVGVNYRKSLVRHDFFKLGREKKNHIINICMCPVSLNEDADVNYVLKAKIVCKIVLFHSYQKINSITYI
jgi:hypothetical protein